MKKIRFAIAAVAMAGMLSVSCESDDNTEAPGNLEGKWTPTKTITVVGNGSPSETTYDGNQAGCDKDYREFVAGGTYRYGVWYLNATNACTEDVIFSTWSKSGDAVTIVDTNPDALIKSPPDAGTYTIMKLTSSELRLESTASSGGVDVQITQIFNRQ